MRTKVFLTVDVECAEERIVGGKLQPPLDYDLRVWGRFRNQKQDLGILLIARELEENGMRGTFFVEPFGSRHFGREGLGEVCDALRSRGHDVQLHTHPIQRDPVFRSAGRAPQPDDIGAYTVGEQAGLLTDGLTLLGQAGVPKRDLLAFRAGNFGAANETWEAMARVGLVLGSNYNPCYFGKNCKMRFADAEAGLFASPVDGVWELPITCFEEPAALKSPYRHLQIAAVTARETIECLRQARALGIGEVTIVTHSFEFYFIDSVGERRGRPNPVNLERLRAILAFLRHHREEFAVETVLSLAQALPRSAAGEGAEARPPKRTFPRGRVSQKCERLVLQAVKRASARMPRLLPSPSFFEK